MVWRGMFVACCVACLLAGSPLLARAPQSGPLPAPRIGHGEIVRIDILHDPGAALEIDDVAAREDLAWQSGTVAFSRTGTGALWLRLPPLSGADIVSLGAMPDRAVLYEAAPGLFDWRTQRTGDGYALRDRALASPRAAFRLSEQVTPRDVRFIRIEQPSRLAFQVTAWSEAGFLAYGDRALAVRILILGFVAAIVLYNLIVSVLSRDRLFALNALTIAGFVSLDLYLSGVGAVWVWPDSPWISNHVLVISLGAIVVFGSRFIALMLDEGNGGAFAARWTRAFGWAAAGLCLASLGVPYWMAFLALLAIALGFVLFATAQAARLALAGQTQARLLLVPLLLSVVPGIFLLLANVWTEFDAGWVGDHLLELTLAFEALCFSLVLAARMRLHRAEAAEARSALAQHRARAAERFTVLQDRERARIAADLHDSLGQSLALTSAQFELARREQGLPEEVEERLSYGLTALREAIAETRRISHALHPATLARFGWHTALRTLVDDFGATHPIETELTLQCPEEHLNADDQVQVLRLVQEALSNVARHAAARWCRVAVVAGADGLRLTVEDDGIGPDRALEVSSDESSLGLLSMRQRAERLGVEFRIERRRPRGTVISAVARPNGPVP